MLACGVASWPVTCELMYICTSSYMYAFIIRGWWNLSIGSAPAMKAMLCKILSSAELFIAIINMLTIVNAMMNLYTFGSNLCRN